MYLFNMFNLFSVCVCVCMICCSFCMFIPRQCYTFRELRQETWNWILRIFWEQNRRLEWKRAQTFPVYQPPHPLLCTITNTRGYQNEWLSEWECLVRVCVFSGRERERVMKDIGSTWSPWAWRPMTMGFVHPLEGKKNNSSNCGLWEINKLKIDTWNKTRDVTTNDWFTKHSPTQNVTNSTIRTEPHFLQIEF
jgi:hypothetical protein